MGNITSPQALILKWEEVLRDPTLRDLPYKIELNAWGKIEMRPARVQHCDVDIARKPAQSLADASENVRRHDILRSPGEILPYGCDDCGIVHTDPISYVD